LIYKMFLLSLGGFFPCHFHGGRPAFFHPTGRDRAFQIRFSRLPQKVMYQYFNNLIRVAAGVSLIRRENKFYDYGYIMIMEGDGPGQVFDLYYNWRFTFWSLLELATTLIELKAMAASASTGCIRPKTARGTMTRL
jgi:hypothetical protein